MYEDDLSPFPVVPLVIVAVSGGAGYKYYINDV